MENQYQVLPNEVQIICQLSQINPNVNLISYNQQFYVLKSFPSEKEFLFNNEVKVSSRLNHPNILSIRDSGIQQEGNFIVTDFMANGSLSSFIEKQPNLSEILLRSIFHYLVAGVEHMHQNGCAHLDLKPDNIVIGDDYQPKIFDFDLSHCAGDQYLSGGTRNFRAPELMISDETLDPVKCDVYSLGIILFMLSTGGFIPFQETDGGELDGVKAVLDSNPELFWAELENHFNLNNYWSNDFKTLFQGMVRSNRFDRYSLEDVKASEWFKGQIYSDETFFDVIGVNFSK